MSERNKHYEPDKLPSAITRKLYVEYGVGKYTAGEIRITDYECSSKDFERVTIATSEITVKIPKKQNIKGKVLKVLEEEKKDILARHHRELQEVQDKIDNLLAIEYKPTI